VSVRRVVFASWLVVLTGCASTTPTRPAVATAGALTQLCALDALLWSHGFVPRASAQQCVTILDSVKMGND